MDAERMERMMSDPNMQQTMNEVLNNPDMVNLLIESNPMLRNMPNAREMLTSPFMRSLMTNPQLMRSAMQMQRGMGGGGNSAFPAPGATDQTSQTGATGEGNNAQGQGNAQQNPFANPFGMMPGMMGNEGGPNLQHLMQAMQPFGQPQAGQAGATTTAQTGTQQSTGETQGATQGQAQSGSENTQGSTPAANPFAALFPPAGGAQGNQTNPANPFGITPEMMTQMQQMMMGGGGGFGGGFGGAPAAPADNRPPEERYADQLRQLNDMGFYDFDRNVAALRRSGGSVQGAVEYLLSAMN
jgi:ubiquilin